MACGFCRPLKPVVPGAPAMPMCATSADRISRAFALAWCTARRTTTSRALPRALVQKLVWLGEPITAQQLLGWGLVGWLAGSGQAFSEALADAQRLADMAPNAIASAKELVQQASTLTLSVQLGAERDHFVANLFHANAGEGLQAFMGKRPPSFE